MGQPEAHSEAIEPAPPTSIRSKLKRMAMLLTTGILLFLFLTTVGCCSLQRKLIYYPPPGGYQPSYAVGLPEGTVELEYTTDDGRQVAFYVPPTESDPKQLPTVLWVMFNGNASLAQDWLDLIESASRTDTGFLLVDYPGYGLCEGSPTRKGILRNIDASYLALADHLGTTTKNLEPHTRAFGFSLGAAVALEFAVRHPPKHVVLLASFTSMQDMARIVVGPVIKHLLIDRFDNRARLAELAALPNPPRVDLFHGTQDDVIPFAMGEELAAAHPSMITFHPIEGSDHNWLPNIAGDQIRKVMTTTFDPEDQKVD